MICNSCGCEYKQVKSWQKFCSKKCKDVEFFLRNPIDTYSNNSKLAVQLKPQKKDKLTGRFV